MPAVTYFLGPTSSAFLSGTPATTILKSFLETSAPGNSTVSWSASASTNYYAYLNSRAMSPGNASWETGTYTVEINITTALARGNVRVRLHRYDTLGNLIESSAFATQQSTQTAGIKTFTFTSLDLSTTGAMSVLDRLVVEIEFIIGTTAGTIAFDIGDTNAEVITPIVSGHVLRPDPTVFDFNAVAPTVTKQYNPAISPAVFDLNAVAPTRTSPLSLAPSPTPFVFAAVAPTVSRPYTLAVSPTPFVFQPVAPSLALAYSLAVSPTPFVFLPVAPEVVMAYDLAVSPTSFVFAAVGPTLDLPLSLAVTPTPFVFQPVGPFLSLSGAAMFMISPTPITFRAVDPTVSLANDLLVTPTPFVFLPAGPTLDLPLSVMLDPAVVEFVVSSPRLFRVAPVVPVLSRQALLASVVESEVRFAIQAARAAGLHLLAETLTRLSRTMTRTAVLED